MKKKKVRIFGTIPGTTGTELGLENEILRIKLRAQTGSDLKHSGDPLPPEVENALLTSIIAFEEGIAGSSLVSIFDFIGKPAFKLSTELSEKELQATLGFFTELLFRHNITIDFGLLSETRSKYDFILNDLFPHQIPDVKVAGMFMHFMYEEFHPDHKKDLKRRALEFISDWFERSMGKFSWELAEEFTLDDGSHLSKEAVLERFRLIFDAYISFKDCQYLLRKIHFDVKEDGSTGTGHVEGGVKFNAVLGSGEVRHFDGPFKLYMSLQQKCWRIFYFIFPGFDW